jgi:small subunit ribosomal protein S12
MTNYNHLIHNPRRARRYKNRRRALQACPQRGATCLKVTIMTPRKPNSAQRKVS